MENIFDKFVLQIKIISQKAQYSFFDMSKEMIDYVSSLSFDDFLAILCEVGTIPERVEHDSTEEKLYSKATDIVLSRSFTELGLKSKVLTERANSADVLAESIYHNYSLVGDAKAFRLSRTAKNQKDFKVKSMNDWRGEENDYSVLVSPYNQYPNTASQIYSQALTANVCLLSWEHLYFLLSKNIKENIDCNLSFVWNVSNTIANNPELKFSDRNKCFISNIEKEICNVLNIPIEQFSHLMQHCKQQTINRGELEISYWEAEIIKIQNFTREQAINELIKSKKINEKIKVIKKYILSLRNTNE